MNMQNKFDWLLEKICQDKGIKKEDVLKRTRIRHIVEIRYIIMKILYTTENKGMDTKNSSVSLSRIGLLFCNEYNPNGYEHSTILYGMKVIEDIMDTNEEFKYYFKILKSNFTYNFYRSSEIFKPAIFDKKALTYALIGR